MKTRYMVYARNTGGSYLTVRARRDATGLKYTWCKDRSRAAVLSEATARRLASNYAGSVVAA